MKSQILLGDCLDVLKTLPDAAVDSVVTDPPYGLGTREPTVEEIVAYLLGARLNTGGDFMSRPWDVPSVDVWKECFRVLKPGGHLLSFGGTRTFDLISVGIRAAGFECRDTVASQFSVMALQWIQGQGFPKSANVSKQLEKLGLSAEEAEQWRGWGTALKPSWEPILCFRKPSSESTVARQVLKTGTGAINIDACRVSSTGTRTIRNYPSEGAQGCITHTGVAGHTGRASECVEREVTAGRWPSNVLITHAPGCTRTGSKRVDAPVINRFTDGAKPFGGGAGHEYVSEQQGDAEGKEEIAVYECQDGCPVKTLDEQSGVLKPGASPAKKGLGSAIVYGEADRAGVAKEREQLDGGGASRFFPQFEQEPYECVDGCPVKTLDDQSGVLKTSGGALNRSGIGFQGGSDGNQDYVPPSEGGASRFFPQFEQESFECVEGCPVKTLDEQSGQSKGGSHIHRRNTALGRMNDDSWLPQPQLGLRYDDEGGASRFFPQFEPLEAPFMYAAKVSKRERDAGLPKGTNVHPTVKPLELMRWLVRLVTAKDGIVLDPYCGSGSTLVAAVKEGLNFIGIERDPEFHRIATMRVASVAPKRDIFDDMEEL